MASRKRRASELAADGAPLVDGDHELIAIAESLGVSTVEVCCCDRDGGINLADVIGWSGTTWFCLKCTGILPTANDKETLIQRTTGTRKDGMIDSGTKEVLKQLDDKPKKNRE